MLLKHPLSYIFFFHFLKLRNSEQLEENINLLVEPETAQELRQPTEQSFPDSVSHWFHQYPACLSHTFASREALGQVTPPT